MSTKIREKLRTADIIYLPGGDPLTLLEEIRQKGVDHLIKEFKGLIIGNSAGALILSSCFLVSKKTPFKGLALTDYCLIVHYAGEKTSNILELSLEKEIIALTNASSIAIKNNKIIATWGTIYKIKDMHVTKIQGKRLNRRPLADELG